MDDLDCFYEHYQEFTGDLKQSIEFLEHYLYLAWIVGFFEGINSCSHTYLKLVPDDVQMQELFERL